MVPLICISVVCMVFCVLYVCFLGGWDLTEWLERLTANAEVATVLGSISASSDTVEGRQMKQCWIKQLKNENKCFLGSGTIERSRQGSTVCRLLGRGLFPFCQCSGSKTCCYGSESGSILLGGVWDAISKQKFEIFLIHSYGKDEVNFPINLCKLNFASINLS